MAIWADALQAVSFIVSPIYGTTKMVLKRCGISDEPQVIVRGPHDRAAEEFIRWWHVQAENVKRKGWWEIKDAPRCIVDLEFTPTSGGASLQTEGMWATDDPTGPVSEMTLRVGDRIRHIPICVRSSKDIQSYADVPAYTTCITGVQFLTHRVSTQRLSAGNYTVLVSIRSGNKIWSQSRFLLRVPKTGLDGFELVDCPNKSAPLRGNSKSFRPTTELATPNPQVAKPELHFFNDFYAEFGISGEPNFTWKDVQPGVPVLRLSFSVSSTGPIVLRTVQLQVAGKVLGPLGWEPYDCGPGYGSILSAYFDPKGINMGKYQATLTVFTDNGEWVPKGPFFIEFSHA